MAKQYAAAWYPDPYAAKGSGILRWYDGSQWTGQVRKPGEGETANPTTSLLKMALSGSAAVVPQKPKSRPPARKDQPSTAAGATWESIPQPGTTFAGGTAPRLDGPGRAMGAIIVLVLIALAGGIVLLTAINDH